MEPNYIAKDVLLLANIAISWLNLVKYFVIPAKKDSTLRISLNPILFLINALNVQTFVLIAADQIIAKKPMNFESFGILKSSENPIYTFWWGK